VSYQERKALIERIQEKNSSKVLTYFLSEREDIPGGVLSALLTGNIGQNVKTIMYDVLKRIGKQQKLDLFIHTRGGDTNAVWPIDRADRSLPPVANTIRPIAGC